MSTVAIATSADGQAAVIRLGTKLSVLGADVATDLGTEELDLAVVGPPNGVVAVFRSPPRVVLYALPELEPAAAIELDAPLRIAGISGSRVALSSSDGKRFVIVRVASRALAAQAIDPGGAAEFAIGLERNQLLFGLPKKLEVWDAVAGRPLLRLQLQLPPPPRSVGASLGHVWATRPGSDEVFVYRLSDGRPFRHHVGSPVERAIGHPGSAIVVLVTGNGLVRLHCFAHSLSPIDAPWTPATVLALHGIGDDIALVGVAFGGEAWRIPLDAPQHVDRVVETLVVAVPVPVETSPTAPLTEPTRAPATTVRGSRAAATWREPLAATVAELARAAGEPATATTTSFPALALPDDCEVSALARRLDLGENARRALTLFYGLSLTGHLLSIAQLARILGDWSEPLGQGELGKHGLLRRDPRGVALRRSVIESLDGARAGHDPRS